MFKKRAMKLQRRELKNNIFQLEERDRKGFLEKSICIAAPAPQHTQPSTRGTVTRQRPSPLPATWEAMAHIWRGVPQPPFYPLSIWNGWKAESLPRLPLSTGELGLARELPLPEIWEADKRQRPFSIAVAADE